jgi:co-chaperonin GroES (HSP10)
MGPRVLVRILEEDGRSPGGLYLPQGVAQEHQDALYAEVVEVARATEDEESLGENVSGIPTGAKILFPKNEGIGVPWDPQLRILPTIAVLALVDEVEFTDAH